MAKFLTFLFLLTSSLCLAQRDSEKVSTNWKTFDTSNYSIQYPAQWELSQKGQMGTTFILFAPLDSAGDQFRENVNLLIQDLTGYNLNLDQFTELSLSQIKTMISNSSLLESKKIKNGSEEHQHVIYTGDQGAFHFQFEQYFWVRDNQAFILTFTADQIKFADYKEVREKILNSFTFKK